MKKRKFFAVVMAAVMTLSMVACGGEQTSNDVTPTTAPTATTAPTKAPDPTATPVPEPQNVTIADASITFEDGNYGFIAPYMQHALSSEVELSLVDFNGSKAVKVDNKTGGIKLPFIAIDVSSLFGADVAKIAGVEMVIGVSHGDGTFRAASGEILSLWGTELDDNTWGTWSVYMEKKNPKIAAAKVPAGNELVADAQNIVMVGIMVDNGAEDSIPASFYVDDIRFYDAAGNTMKPADTSVAYNGPQDETDYSIYKLSNAVDFAGYTCSGTGWGQNGAEFTQELLDALVPGTALEINFKSEDGTMWAVFPDATPGGTAAWTRVAQGTAAINDACSKAQITYEQIVAAVGENKEEWGARLQFEAQTNWEVYGISVGKYSKNVSMTNPVAFEGYACSGTGWGQNGADFTQELLDALVPGTALKISYKSDDGSMWAVFPDATPGGTAVWSRVAQGTAICDGSVAYIPYDQIVAAVGEDKTQWGARLQFEAATNWEVYGIEVGQFVEYPVMGHFVDFAGYGCSGTGWGQNGFEFTEELLAALVPGSILKIAYKSEDGTMWAVFPDATPGGTAAWTRVAQGAAICTGSEAYITYEQIVAAVGENQAEWGARLQFEAQTNWEVFGISVGKYVVEESAEEEGEEEPAPVLEDPTIQVADGTVVFTGSKTFSDTAWWTQLSWKDAKAEIIGETPVEDITAIKFTADTNFVLGFKDVNGNWVQTDNVEGPYVIHSMELGDDWDLCLALSKGDGVEYTITWEVYTGGSTEIIVPEEPAEPVIDPTTDTIEGTVAYNGSLTFADSAWWTQKDLFKADLIGDLDPATVKGIKFTSDTTFFLGFTDSATDEWWQKDATSFVAKTITFEKENATDPVVCLYLSKGDGVEYTINWEVYLNDDAATGTTDEPATDAPAAEGVTTTLDGSYVGDYGVYWIENDKLAGCENGAVLSFNFARAGEAEGYTNTYWNFTLINGVDGWPKLLDDKYYISDKPAYSAEWGFMDMNDTAVTSFTTTLSADAIAEVAAGKLGIQVGGMIILDYTITPVK